MTDGVAADASIVLFGDGRDWHGKSLLRAFKKRAAAASDCRIISRRSIGAP